MSLEKLEDNLYVLHGGCSCGNTTFYITDAGVVMVDTKVAGTGEAILEQLRTVTDKPIAMIINTHTHFDHTESNTEFGAVDRIVTHAPGVVMSPPPPDGADDLTRPCECRFVPAQLFGLRSPDGQRSRYRSVWVTIDESSEPRQDRPVAHNSVR